MDELRKHQVSLRGASAKEITREALLDKVSHERELRSFNRRAAVAALFIQRVWRRYYLTKKVAMQLQEEWRAMIKHNVLSMTRSWVSNDLLRPFLFFITHSSIRHQKIQATDMDCMMTCFKILLESINSTESQKNFCSLATSTPEERKKWLYQAQRLISVCSSILSECDHTCPRDQDISRLTALAMRLAVALTDLKGWKNISDNIKDADAAVKELINFMATRKSGLYSCIRRYIMKLDGHVASRRSIDVPTDEIFLITASAITLALRPFNIAKLAANDTAPLNVKDAAELYCVHILTIPWLAQRLPAVLLPAVRHNCVLSPCLWVLHILKEKILTEMYKLDQSKCKSRPKVIPHVGWALANIINLATEFDSNSVCLGQFTRGLNCTFYVRVVSMYAENLLAWLENIGLVRKDNQNYLGNAVTSGDSIYADVWESETTLVSSKMSFIDLLMPVHQQWHLLKLLALIKNDVFTQEMDASPQKEIVESFGMLGLIDIAYFYSHMLRIFSSLNHTGGSLPVLNMLSFTPGFLVNLWGELESLIPFVSHSAKGDKPCTSRNGKGDDRIFDRKQSQKVTTKDTGNRWITVLQKITLKSSTGFNYMHSINGEPRFNEFNENIGELWEIKPFRWGPQSISKDMSCLLHLFCATYSHLLLVLDDIEFYEKQTPFTLEQQRRIASVLNTLVYNGLSNNSGLQNLPLMDAAVRCLHFLYERDCRHQFCPSPLWLSPGLNNRPPIAAVVRTHEAALASFRSGDASASQGMGSIITTTPHVFPFEERVQMFREFIRLDKDSRGMAGALDTRSIEIVVHRGHIVEDGFKQLNYLGSKLKSCIHVSFISECGLPEAGLDYGGLSKEFLIEISKAAFSPEYGLFSQTSTSERLLIPNTAARSLENGIEMIEFLGRVVGKALYEGILLDYSFSLVFVQKLLGRYGFLDELSTLDPELYRNLIYVKNYDGDVKDLSLDFTVTEELLGRRVTIDLKPGGKDIAVTNDNKLQYVHAIADYKLNRQILPLADAFYRGLIDLISPSWLALFNASEFNQLLSGGNHDIDVNDLKNNTRYTGGYSEGSRTVKLFWGVISGFEPKERCMLLKFVTSCSRPPLLGFKHLQPTFTIHKVACDLPLWATIGGQDVDRLPSASTCYNTLKLPTYKRATTLRAKLLYAISSNAGFELS